MRILVLRWFFFLGFIFLVMTGAWAIVMIARLKREQVVAMALLETIAAQAGLRRAVDKLSLGTQESVAREDRESS